ncbi:MAG: deacylase [Gemmatales bacterium]|nr:MAG: deacylase [Gemmatales bacterium]
MILEKNANGIAALPMNDSIATIEKLDIAQLPAGRLSRWWLTLTDSAFGEPIRIPILALRSTRPGPVLGVTAALHGNEVNGIRVIQKLFQQVSAADVRGVLIGVPVVNVPAFHAQQRFFTDDVDLNRIMPGKADGNASEVYASRLIERFYCNLNYLIDLHTASFGRTNSYYVRADMTDPEAATLARLQNAPIIVSGSGEAGTLRSQLHERGVVGITVELCDPHIFQRQVIDQSLQGLHNTMVHLGMIPGRIIAPPRPPIECRTSYWMHTDRGGLLEVLPSLGDVLAPHQTVARLYNIFGDLITEYRSPERGIVVGKSTNPVNQTGGRILHLGVY